MELSGAGAENNINFSAATPARAKKNGFGRLRLRNTVHILNIFTGQETSISHRLRVSSELFDMLSDNSQVLFYDFSLTDKAYFAFGNYTLVRV